jgi:hypothetical protein
MKGPRIKRLVQAKIKKQQQLIPYKDDLIKDRLGGG